MVRVACMVMLKNERTMTPLFLGYHAALFGAENVYVFDNGSVDVDVLAELERFEAMGVNVERGYTTAVDFHHKGTVLGDLIKRLDRDTDYDFYIPLDCDEFVVLRTPDGYSADPDQIRGYLEGFRHEQRILHVTLNLSNLLGQPDHFQAAEYSKTVYPHGVFLNMDHGYHTGVVRDDTSPYVDCDLVYAHFHYRPYEEVVEFAKQKLRTELSEAEIENHAQLRNFRGLGWHMVHYVVDGPEAYYSQFRNVANAVAFPALGERFAAIGLAAPFGSFRLPPTPEAGSTTPPHLVIDEASTARVRGWAMDQFAPDEPMFLRFLLDGALVWEGACDQERPDVRVGGHPTDRVGFDFMPTRGAAAGEYRILTIEDRNGAQVRASMGGRARYEITLASAVERLEPRGEVYSHVDSFKSGRVQGWVLRTVSTPEGPRLLGCCTVVLVHSETVVTQTVADIVREDVAEAMQGEARCGFVIEVPRSLLSASVFRLYIMPESRELVGSPCVLAPSFIGVHPTAASPRAGAQALS
jgi:hypothetical protein